MTTMEELERRIRENERRHQAIRPARRWEWYEERVPIEIVTLPSASYPTRAVRQVDSLGILNVPVLSFSQTVTQYIEYVWHAPEDLNPDQPVYIHAMWIPGASWTTGNYNIYIRYLVLAENGVVGATAGTDIQTTVTPASATALIETELTNQIRVGPEQLLFIRYIRDVSLDNGNDVLQLLFIEIEYARWLDGRRPDVPFELSR